MNSQTNDDIKRTKKLTQYEKNRIVIYHNDNMNINGIANKIGLHRNTVSRVISRYREYGDEGLNRRKGTGKIKNKNNDVDIGISVVKLITIHKYATLDELNKLLRQEEINISNYKLRYILHQHDFEYGLPPSKVPLTEEIKYKRLLFAIKYKQIDWDMVLFSDECSIWEGMQTMQRWFNSNLGIDYDVTFKHTKKLNIWGVINSNKKINIHIFNQNMDANEYVAILKDHLLPYYDKKLYFQYDNDPKHTSSKAKLFLTKHLIKCIDFPPYSPDLNPIENVWSLLKHNVGKRKNEITSANFKNIIIEEWNKIDQNIIAKIIRTMPERLEKIIKNKGDHLDY